MDRYISILLKHILILLQHPAFFFSFSLPNTAPTLSDCQDIASDHLTDVHFDSGLGSGWAPSKL